ncbi:MAG: hypothetical protein JNM63_14585, partial [Spirochaetia bacterium]|nr:hypothetical protein [Spirochaetia bacterium]
MPTAEMRKEPSVSNDFHSIVVVGASGDLARKKIYPSLFHLYYNNLLPTNFVIVGYARTDMPEAEFHEKILKNLSCRTMDKDHCQAKMAEFMKKCRYLAGQYDQPEDFKKLDTFLKGFEPAGKVANRLFYFSIPPSVFVDVATSIGKAAKAVSGWNRLILEKPFGRDTE